ncbi:MAG: FAD-dependent monooxygenase [Xanthobacteraceae bacterium]
MSAPKETNTPVAIVGGGPVGLVLALLLDFHGMQCTIFNTEPHSRWHPKGNGQNARTMELAIICHLTKTLSHGNILLRLKLRDSRHGKTS